MRGRDHGNGKLDRTAVRALNLDVPKARIFVQFMCLGRATKQEKHVFCQVAAEGAAGNFPWMSGTRFSKLAMSPYFILMSCT